jgi:hypothetical protein
MSNPNLRRTLIVLLAAAATAAATNADTIHVPGDRGGIQGAIDAAQDGDIVVVADGTYTGEDNKNLDFGGKAITVRSGNGPDNCIIDCQGDGRGFYFHSGEGADSVVEGFTIRNGNPDYFGPGGNYGAGVYCSGSSPTIVRCIIAWNTAGGGGGFYCVQSSPTIRGCTIAGNWAWISGGGIFCDDLGNPVITNCTIAANFLDSTGGGGVHCQYESSPSIVNCTIAWNTVLETQGSAGIYCTNSSSPTIIRCILWENWPMEIEVSSSSCHPVVTYSDVQRGWLGEGNIGVDPLFADPYGDDLNPATWEDNDYHLTAASPCIDAGNPNFVPEPADRDIDGQWRVWDGDQDDDWRVDMGSDEFGSHCPGDLDGDDDIDLGDLAGLLAHYGTTSGMTPADGDFDLDGDIDLSDLSALLAVYGTICEG